MHAGIKQFLKLPQHPKEGVIVDNTLSMKVHFCMTEELRIWYRTGRVSKKHSGWGCSKVLQMVSATHKCWLPTSLWGTSCSLVAHKVCSPGQGSSQQWSWSNPCFFGQTNVYPGCLSGRRRKFLVSIKLDLQVSWYPTPKVYDKSINKCVDN